MKNLEFYLAQPWTIERADENYDVPNVELRVRELQGFLVVGESDEEVEAAFWPALELFLESYLQDGEEPPIPASPSRLPAETTEDSGGTAEFEWEPSATPRFSTADVGTSSRVVTVRQVLKEQLTGS